MSQQINLFNPAFKKQDKSFSALTMLRAFGVIILGSLLVYGYADYQGRQLTLQLDESVRRFKSEQERLTRLTAEFSPQQSGQALQDDVQQLEKKLGEQTGLIETLKSGSGAVGNTSGYSEYMRAFSRQAVQGLWLTSFQVSGGEAQISLSGAVLNPESLPAYIQRLGQESVMRGKTFTTLQMQQPKAEGSAAAGSAAAPRYVEFRLHSTPDGEARNSGTQSSEARK